MNRNWPLMAGIGLFLLSVGAAFGVGGFYMREEGPKPIVLSSVAQEAPEAEADPVKLQKLCSYCHQVPAPDLYPKYHWPEEIKRAFEFIRKSDIQTDHYPSMDSIIQYYVKRAPNDYPAMKRMNAADQPFACTFKPESFKPKEMPPHPGVTNLNLVNLYDPKKKDILMCHTRPGEIWVLQPYTNPPAWRLLGKCLAPVHAEVVDLDGDGVKDLLVADIGSLFPDNVRAGRVLWFKGDGKGNFAEPITLMEGLGRTVDVQAANFMGHKDGKLDLVVAVFGWHTTGEVRVLINETTDWTKPKFVSKILDARPGTIHVPVIDLNGDGKPDIVACISQETERIVAFLNQGNGEFAMKDLYIAPHPGWGFSGIQMVDMNNDGKPDILFSNGDILDPPFLMKPFHGVQWIENPGHDKEGRMTFPWKNVHRIDGLHGTMRAFAADLSGNGLMDVVAVNFLPPQRFPQRKKENLDSVVIFEQVKDAAGPGKGEISWRRHVLETVSADHLTCIAGDLLGTGNMDLVVGNFFLSPSETQQPDSLTIWWNQGKRKAKK